MKLLLILLVSCSIFLKTSSCQNTNGPLILTPLIKAGKFQEAQDAARVKFDQLDDIENYAGYFTVNNQYNSNLFFWFFPSQTDYVNDPVLLWLQGGPGASSLFGLFLENGPFVVRSNFKLKRRRHSWTANNSVIYIDNPVGTGFSFTNEGGFARNQTAVADQLYEALLQFFQMFPNLQQNPFFVTGESYAGKYAPAIAYAIHKNNPGAVQKINLQGVAIGNGFCDPIHQSNYSDYLYQIGLIDSNEKIKLKQVEEAGIELVKQEEWYKAAILFDGLMDGDFTKNGTFFKNFTGFSNYLNYLQAKENDKSEKIFQTFLQRPDVQEAIHVGNVSFNFESRSVLENLQEDIYKSVAPWISELLSHYKILFYNGQLDIIVAYPLTVNFLKNLDFDAAEEYKTATRHQWYVDHDLAGYAKTAGNLTEILVRNAGHMVPMDQPAFALDLINRFAKNKPFW